MQGTRQHFVDSFLSLCSVETFSTGEDLLYRGSISAALYLLIDGTVGIIESDNRDFIGDENDTDLTASSYSIDTVSGIQQTSGFINELGKLAIMPEHLILLKCFLCLLTT
jgi:signal-transduction protein with cAMP-binding, CBS, and nucleotidyltransferase domain